MPSDGPTKQSTWGLLWTNNSHTPGTSPKSIGRQREPRT
ncbi:hypothetical protein Trydic_g23067, partial [Trypoxylus dichotomus]